MSVPPSRASGWYPDPHNASVQRYWNGRVWTGRTMPAAPAVTAQGAGPTPVPPTPAKAPGLPVGGIVAISVIEEMGGF